MGIFNGLLNLAETVVTTPFAIVKDVATVVTGDDATHTVEKIDDAIDAIDETLGGI